jgi:hypothetical protein
MSRPSSVLSSTGPLHVPAFLTLSDHSQNFDLPLSHISMTIVQIRTADGFEKKVNNSRVFPKFSLQTHLK